MEGLEDRIIAYLSKAETPARRRLDVVASIFGMSISEFTLIVEALERAGRLRVEHPRSSTILSTSDTPSSTGR